VSARPLFVAACSILGVALSGCTVGPNYRQPQVGTPPRYEAVRAGGSTTITTEDADLTQWWTRFDDPLLTTLVRRALAQSLSLATADSLIRAARFKETEIGAAEYPSVSAATSALRLHSNDAAGPLPSRLSQYSAGFDASWELDLFGATRRAVEEAKANTEVSVWEKRDGEVSLAAEVANDYLTLRAFQARILVLGAELTRQRQLFALIQARRSAGFITNLDVNQQTTLVATAAAQMPQLQAEAQARIHALAVLLGQAPESLSGELNGGGPIGVPPPTLPLGLPSELLLRRPDVRAAERRLAASNAAIGVRTAGFYPKINLIGLVSFAGSSDLLATQNLLAAALGLIREPIFDGGRIRAGLGQAQEARTQAQLAYRLAVLGALRDVEDGLARYQAEETRRDELAKSVSAAEATLGIAQDRYRTGFVTFVDVLNAQYALLGTKDQLTQSEALLATDLIALYKALGGGWAG
jgi:NodT family efflux transporter outer membrane factor (OMF) lipoprotein